MSYRLALLNIRDYFALKVLQLNLKNLVFDQLETLGFNYFGMMLRWRSTFADLRSTLN